MTIIEKLAKLRSLMEERNLDAYFIPTSDFHETEYVGEYFKARQYMSGFSGSQGTLVVMKEQAALWTDGRYFIQAENELKNSTITLMRMGEEGVPTIQEYLGMYLPQHGCLGFDGRVMNTAFVESMLTALKEKQVSLRYEEDLVGMIWEGRPALPTKQGFYLEETYSGKSTKDKLVDIRAKMKSLHTTAHIITSLDDIAWILNMRGWDIACYPVMLSYLIIEEENAYVFIEQNKLTAELQANFTNNHIEVQPYHAIYEFVKTLSHERVLLNKAVVNYAIVQNLPLHIEIVDKVNPSQLMKAMKNEVEQKMNKIAHIKDGVAITKFMYWLKQNVGNQEITEMSASDYLLSLRQQQENFLEPSFSTIAAYKEHAAMMHYSANKETDVALKKEGLFLVDSGGQYLEGTTDITRTFVLGPISDEIRLHFTTALRGFIRLAQAKFLHGCRGMNLDILARGPLWDLALDYKCGTGHGVGHLLNVHEGPNGFRWRIVPERNDSCILEEGMTQSNEPGVYVEGSHGIRHENEMVVRKGVKNEYGQFMYLENITFAPFDIDGLDSSYMTQYEIAWLNAYHQEVYETISPYLTKEEASWLKEVTKPIV